MRLGVLGAGMMVHMALPTIKTLGPEKIYLLARPQSEEKARALAAEFGLDEVFVDYDALLASDVDAVYIALPNLLHYDYAKAALLAGKHVLVEKPAVTRLAQWDELCGLAQERNLALMEAMTVHALPAFQSLRRQVKKIGDIRQVIFTYPQRSSRYDDFLHGKVHPVFDPNQAGGALMDLNVYNLHALLGLFGPPQAARYQAEVVRGIDVNGGLTLDYEKFHAVAVAAKDQNGTQGGTIWGENGILHFDGPVSCLTRFTLTLSGGKTREYDFPCERLLPEFQCFLKAVETGDRKELTRLSALTAQATRILETARAQAGVRFPGDGETPD